MSNANKVQLVAPSVMKVITPQEMIFCEDYLVHWSPKHAAEVSGIDPNTAATLLRKAHIKAYLDISMQEFRERLHISAYRNAQELAKIAYSSMGNFKHNWITLKDFNDLSEADKAGIASVKYHVKDIKRAGTNDVIRTETMVEFKLHDKLKAIEMLNRMYGFNAPEKVETTHATNRRARISFG